MYTGQALQEQQTPAEVLAKAERRATLRAFAEEVLVALATASVVIPLTVWLLMEALP